MLTPHCSAASGMVAPPCIVSITRLRKSSEYGFAIHAGLLPVGSLNHIRADMGIPDSAFSGNALSAKSASADFCATGPESITADSGYGFRALGPLGPRLGRTARCDNA